jgi:hypothetical protein
MFIPDPDVSIPNPGSRSERNWIPDPDPQQRMKVLLTPLKTDTSISSRIYDPGCLLRIPTLDPAFLPIPDPGSRGQKGTGSRIRNTDDVITRRENKREGRRLNLEEGLLLL